MSVRHFTAASSEKITLSLGTTNFAFGPGTLAAIIKTEATFSTTRFIFSVGGSAAASYVLAYDSTGHPGCILNGSAAVGATALGTSATYLVAVTKATGTVAPRVHSYDYAALAWVHENSATSLANSSVPITRAAIGTNTIASAFYNGDIAAVGVWNVVLTDSQIQDLLLFQPVVSKGMWSLNQDVTSGTLRDITGGGADQTAITGTSVTAVIQDVGMANLAPPKPFEPRVGSYGLQAMNRAASF